MIRRNNCIKLSRYQLFAGLCVELNMLPVRAKGIAGKCQSWCASRDIPPSFQVRTSHKHCKEGWPQRGEERMLLLGFVTCGKMQRPCGEASPCSAGAGCSPGRPAFAQKEEQEWGAARTGLSAAAGLLPLPCYQSAGKSP